MIKEIVEAYIIKVGSLLGLEVKIEYTLINVLKKEFSYTFILRNKDNVPIARFSLIQMPGCCGICISTESWIAIQHRRKGLGTLLNIMRIEVAKALGYTILMCTDIHDNEPQQLILKKNGWNRQFTFLNTRTNNWVDLHTINLF